MKSLLNNKKVQSVSDERGNDDGIWVYLKDEFADFTNDPHHPTRQIHEDTVEQCMARVKSSRLVTEKDKLKFESLQ